MKNIVFWDWWLSLQPPAHAGSSLADFSALKMEAIRSSETSVHTRSTQRHIPEDGILHSHRCENLKSFKFRKDWFSRSKVNGGIYRDTDSMVIA
jgi:hypothetical protein